MRLSNGDVLLHWPLAQHIITAGWLYNDGSLHRALDFRAAVGTPVYAAEGGTVEFKTDNRDLFDFSVEEVKEAGWKLLACTYDLHHDEELSRGNVMTEYEEKFSSMGNPIHKLVTAR